VLLHAERKKDCAEPKAIERNKKVIIKYPEANQ